MLPLIYTVPAYIMTFVAVIVISRVPEIISASRWRSKRDPTARQVDRGSFVVMGIVTGGGVMWPVPWQPSGRPPRFPGSGLR